MVIRAVVFDIGGVLEVTPDLGVDRLWETQLGLPAGKFSSECATSGGGVCVTGARDLGIHAIRYQDDPQAIAEIEEFLGPLISVPGIKAVIRRVRGLKTVEPAIHPGRLLHCLSHGKAHQSLS